MQQQQKLASLLQLHENKVLHWTSHLIEGDGAVSAPGGGRAASASNSVVRICVCEDDWHDNNTGIYVCVQDIWVWAKLSTRTGDGTGSSREAINMESLEKREGSVLAEYASGVSAVGAVCDRSENWELGLGRECLWTRWRFRSWLSVAFGMRTKGRGSGGWISLQRVFQRSMTPSKRVSRKKGRW